MAFHFGDINCDSFSRGSPYTPDVLRYSDAFEREGVFRGELEMNGFEYLYGGDGEDDEGDEGDRDDRDNEGYGDDERNGDGEENEDNGEGTDNEEEEGNGEDEDSEEDEDDDSEGDEDNEEDDEDEEGEGIHEDDIIAVASLNRPWIQRPRTIDAPFIRALHQPIITTPIVRLIESYIEILEGPDPNNPPNWLADILDNYSDHLSEDWAIRNGVRGWTTHHDYFLWSCRGPVPVITDHIQAVFGFEPQIGESFIVQKLSGLNALKQLTFLRAYLPGETHSLQRAEARGVLFEANLSLPEVRGGFLELDVEQFNPGDPRYPQPIIPSQAPDVWTRNDDALAMGYLGSDPEEFKKDFETLYPDRPVDIEFLRIRMAQLPHLNITWEELQLAQMYRNYLWL